MTVINDEFKENTGKRLRALREKKGLTISELAEKISNKYLCSIDEKSIRRYEKGEFLPKIDNLICFADFFDTTLDFIIYGKELSDDNSFTWYDNFKRLNRLIYSLSLIPFKNSENGNICLELWEDEAKLFFEKINAYSKGLNYMFESKGESASFSVKELDYLFEDFRKYNEQLVPVALDRYNKCLKNHGIDPEKHMIAHLERIKSKRSK